MLAAEAAVNAANFLLPALFLGALVTAGVFLPEREPAGLGRSLVGLALAALALFVVTSFLSLLLQGAKLSSGEFPSWNTLTRYTLRTQSGNVWIGREGYAGLLFLGTFWISRRECGRRNARWLLLLSLPLVASRSLSSHAAAVKENTWLVIASDALHLIAVALWAGALPFLFWVLRRGFSFPIAPLPWVSGVVERFSRLALLSVAVLGTTGLYQSWVHLGRLEALWQTSYGNVLLLKLLLFLGMLALGAWNFFFTRSRLSRAASAQLSDRRALKKIAAEGLLGLFVFPVTGLLTALPPGVHGSHILHSHPAASRGSTPRLDPAEGARITLISPRSGQVFKGDQVPVTFTFVKGKRGEHVHAYVDGRLMGMFKSEKGTLTGIPPGRHNLELRPVTGDHQTELDAIAAVEFMVE
jgi:putative copper export protein